MILAANFKMNHTRSSTKAYIEKLNAHGKQEGVDVYIFPPYTALDSYQTFATIGAQNGYPAQKGSFTGEIGLEQLEEFGIETIILGHSERRHLMGEDQELIAKKFEFFKQEGFTIFYCVGETAEVKRSGSTQLIEAYLDAQLEGIDTRYDKLVVAYEPVWAIGTGQSATPEDIEASLRYLRSKTSAPLLYGGSVKPANVAEIVTLPECAGALIGTASWSVESFCEMIDIVKEL